MSQRISPLLFNTYLYTNSKWFTQKNLKFSLNEDLQIRDIVHIIFKQSIISQYLFLDRVVIYKYSSKIRLYIYFICNFTNLKQNLIKNNITTPTYLSTYLYYKYFELLQIKKIELIKLLRPVINSNLTIYVNYKNLNSMFNKIQNLTQSTTFNSNLIKVSRTTNSKYLNITYFKSLRYLLYVLCYPQFTILNISAQNLANLIFYELDKLDNTVKNYNFLFYTFFNILRDQLTIYLKDDSCKLSGIRIQIKGRYFLTKRKKIFIFNMGHLNLNQLKIYKDYYSLNLIKSTGASTIKIWLSYKK
jgi:hypothetical protein|uniref:Ribosomal protein S3 n=1 Tax=Blastocystis sp. DMP/02-328 TaxID=463136 RepID=B5SQ51_9STRA|nr:ribosomal protein S3 [Blastocystis sp. DMP/02-328]YP_009166972.1 ribosomal protein S3 [Blastocystis sp. subtype 4]ACH86042.1 ribosomal protein S3 [Blastocystis sp. DMP/02-328]ALC78924.1 ribosomal protein S3 [Blastocystis sp. subtype 4]